MSEASVRKAVLQDALDLAPKIRKTDRVEIRASDNQSPLEALVKPFTVDVSKIFSIIIHDKVIRMFDSSLFD